MLSQVSRMSNRANPLADVWIRMTAMRKTFEIGEHVRWNSEAVGLVES